MIRSSTSLIRSDVRNRRRYNSSFAVKLRRSRSLGVAAQLWLRGWYRRTDGLAIHSRPAKSGPNPAIPGEDIGQPLPHTDPGLPAARLCKGGAGDRQCRKPPTAGQVVLDVGIGEAI